MAFDMTCGAYVWCADNHGGQGSREYSVMSRIAARGIHLSDSAWRQIREGGDEWAGAHEVYRALDADRHGGEVPEDGGGDDGLAKHGE